MPTALRWLSRSTVERQHNNIVESFETLIHVPCEWPFGCVAEKLLASDVMGDIREFLCVPAESVVER